MFLLTIRMHILSSQLRRLVNLNFDHQPSYLATYQNNLSLTTLTGVCMCVCVWGGHACLHACVHVCKVEKERPLSYCNAFLQDDSCAMATLNYPRPFCEHAGILCDALTSNSSDLPALSEDDISKGIALELSQFQPLVGEFLWMDN